MKDDEFEEDEQARKVMVPPLLDGMQVRRSCLTSGNPLRIRRTWRECLNQCVPAMLGGFARPLPCEGRV
jgi:hypothetical protein